MTPDVRSSGRRGRPARPAPAVDQLLIDSVSRLAMRLQKSGDRFTHQIEVQSSGSGRAAGGPLLTCLEGGSDDIWPVSPPLQQLSVEPQSSGNVALLVGMAGHSHWSAAAFTDPTGGLVFDVACRTEQTPERLGVAYRLHRDVQIRIRPAHVELLLGADAFRVRFDDQPPFCPGAWRLDREQLIGSVEAANPSPQATTLRWRYRIEPV